MATKKTRIKLGFHSGTGQYRKFVRGKMHYFGSDEKTALPRYSFFLETGLVYKSGYRQLCRVENGHIRPLGRTIEEARRNLAARNESESVTKPPTSLDIVIRSVTNPLLPTRPTSRATSTAWPCRWSRKSPKSFSTVGPMRSCRTQLIYNGLSACMSWRDKRLRSLFRATCSP